MPEDNYTERFIRWQAIAIDQRGKTINVILSLSLATIAFIANQIMDKDFHFESCFAKIFIGFGSFSLFICTAISLWLNINRLKDFDETKNIIKSKSKGHNNDEIEHLESINKATGKKTRCGFVSSLWCFGIGELLIVIGLVGQIIEKIK